MTLEIRPLRGERGESNREGNSSTHVCIWIDYIVFRSKVLLPGSLLLVAARGEFRVQFTALTATHGEVGANGALSVYISGMDRKTPSI